MSDEEDTSLYDKDSSTKDTANTSANNAESILEDLNLISDSETGTEIEECVLHWDTTLFDDHEVE